MKYILKHERFYFLGFDEEWPTWMINVDSAKRYPSLHAAEEENGKILKMLKYKCEIIEI